MVADVMSYFSIAPSTVNLSGKLPDWQGYAENGLFKRWKLIPRKITIAFTMNEMLAGLCGSPSYF